MEKDISAALISSLSHKILMTTVKMNCYVMRYRRWASLRES